VVKNFIILTLLSLALVSGSAVAVNQANNSELKAKLGQLNTQIDGLQQRIQALGSGTAAKKKGGFWSGIVGTNHALMLSLLNNANVTGKASRLLAAQKAGAFGAAPVIVGGLLKGAMAYEIASGEILGGYRHTIGPFNITSKAFSGMWLDTARLGMAVGLSKNISAFIAMGRDSYYGNSYSYSPTLDGLQQAYMVFNLAGVANHFPLDAFAGKKWIDFGAMKRLTPYTDPMTRILGLRVGDALGLGFDQGGLSGVLSVFNGGRGPEGGYLRLWTYTRAFHLNNFAANLGYGVKVSGAKLHFGVGYLNGGSLMFLSRNNAPNSEIDMNASANMNNMTWVAEYVTTASNSELSNDKWYAWDISTKYAFDWAGRNSAFSASYGLFHTFNPVASGPLPHPSINSSQLVLGFDQDIMANINVGLEYRYSTNILGVSGTKDNAFIAVLTTSFYPVFTVVLVISSQSVIMKKPPEGGFFFKTRRLGGEELYCTDFIELSFGEWFGGCG